MIRYYFAAACKKIVYDNLYGYLQPKLPALWIKAYAPITHSNRTKGRIGPRHDKLYFESIQRYYLCYTMRSTGISF